MNQDIFLTCLAVGGITKLITLKRPTPGRQVATAAGLLLTAVFLSILIPEDDTYTAEMVLIAWAVMDIFGEYVGRVVDKYRVTKEAKEWLKTTEQAQRTRL